MSKPEGIYMSVDYRVSDAKTGKVLDDASVKFVTVHFFPVGGGPTALIAYCGLAVMPGGMPVGDWLRETMSGRNEDFKSAMSHLNQQLDKTLGWYLKRHKVQLVVNVFVLAGIAASSGDSRTWAEVLMSRAFLDTS
jgi:hypothetical protein